MRMLLEHGIFVEVLALLAAICGVLWSAVLTVEAYRDWRGIRRNGHSRLKRRITWQWCRTQGLIGLTQVALGVVTALVFTLPPPYAYESQLGVRLAIRLLRIGAVLLLAYQALAARRDRQALMDDLDAEAA